MTAAVYGIRCKANGRVYVGSSVNVSRRFYLHRLDLQAGRHHSPKLQNAWNKYGIESFSFEILEYVEDHIFLTAREQFWIWRTELFSLNCSPIAGSPLGVKRTDEQKDRMSAAKRAFYRTDKGKNQLEAMHSKNRGRVQSKEERDKRSASLKGKAGRRDWTDEDRKRHSVSLTGRKMPPVSDETRERISRAKKGIARSPEAIKASVEARTAFVGEEADHWVEMYSSGNSFREIARITGRSRSVIAREVKARIG